MARRRGFKIPGLSFSLNRALGITRMKQRFARSTGIPTTKAGMERKIGRAVTRGCCLMPVLSFLIVLGSIVFTLLF
jgi:hypothetical protein